MSHEVVTLESGVLAVRSTESGEVMHPGVGPRAEAELLYVRQSRLAERLPAVLFDVGLGAGSNALAARAAAERAGGHLTMVSFERDLGALALALEHGEAFGLAPGSEPAQAARALLDDGHHESAHTSWRLSRGDVLERLAAEPSRADIVFWDPFSPRANPGLWTIAAFTAMRQAAGPRCTLFTYSASTATRIALLLAGWVVGIGDPIGLKRETTAAAIELDDLARPLDRQWRQRLHRSDVPLPTDAPADAAALAGRAPQFR